MKLSIIVPCYNEAEVINEFYEEMTSSLLKENISYEILMIDDGSNDETLNKIKELNVKDKKVKSISFSRNFGKEAAMLAGLEYASGEYTAIIDADLQQQPDTLIEMYKKLLDNPDFDEVASYRESHQDENKIKVVLTSIFYKIINRISDVKMLPGASDFRVFNKKVKEALISLREKNRFLKGMFSWVGFNTIYVPYTPNKRLLGKSKWSLYKLAKYAVDGMASFSTLPIKLVSYIGVIVFIISLLNFILLGELGSKAIILILGLMFLSISILSIYFKRMYVNIIDRPIYIIKEKIGFDKKNN